LARVVIGIEDKIMAKKKEATTGKLVATKANQLLDPSPRKGVSQGRNPITKKGGVSVAGSKGTATAVRNAESGRYTLKDLERFEKDTSLTSKAIIRSMRATYKSTHGAKRAGRA
jgi:hypothetical protein